MTDPSPGVVRAYVSREDLENAQRGQKNLIIAGLIASNPMLNPNVELIPPSDLFSDLWTVVIREGKPPMDVANGLVGLEEVSDYQLKATRIVRHYIEKTLDKSDPRVDFKVYVVWFVKTLQNWKALVSSSLPDGRYYEVTYDGHNLCTYVDVYVKIENFPVFDGTIDENHQPKAAEPVAMADA